MEGSSSDNNKKSYPIRNLIRRDVVSNIRNWLQDDENDVLYSESEEEAEVSCVQLEDGEISLETTQIESEENNSYNVDNVDEVDDGILLQDLLVGDKRKRGCPPASKTKKSSLDQQHNVIVDEWEEVVGNDGMRKHKFRFIPAKQSGVHADLDETSTAF